MIFDQGKAETVNRSQGSAQVMGNAITEAFQFLVDGREFRVAQFEDLVQLSNTVLRLFAFSDVTNGTGDQRPFLCL